jgi:hypothetical protein
MALFLAGCEPALPVEGARPPRTEERDPPELAKLRATQKALEASLAEVERKLAAATADEAEALRHERLRILVALRLLDDRLAAPRPPAPEPSALLAEADERIADARDNPVPDDGDFGVGVGGLAPPAAEDKGAAESARAAAELEYLARRRAAEERDRQELAEREKKEAQKLGEDDETGSAPGEGGEVPPGWERGPDGRLRKRKAGGKGKNKPGGIEKAMVLPGRDPTADVEAAIDREMGRLRQCAAQGGARGPVDMTVHAQLAGDGALRRVRIADAAVAPQIGDCIVRVLEGLRVPGSGGEERQITVPLSLR